MSMPTAALPPGPDGLRRLARALDAKAANAGRPLEGGAACSVQRVTLDGGPHRSVVLKRSPSFNGVADVEWQALCFASRNPVRSPQPLAFDPAGEWFGTRRSSCHVCQVGSY